MLRTSLLAFSLCCAVLAGSAAAEPPRNDQHVRWTLDRDIKQAIGAEIRRFEADLREKLGPQGLAFQPYAGRENVPGGKQQAEPNVEQLIAAMIQSLDKLAARDKQDFLPHFSAYRRAPVERGSDLLSAPVMGPPGVGQTSGNLTFKLEWEQANGRFASSWNHNDVDEVYQVELSATLTLGVDLKLTSDRKTTLISHSTTRPIVARWKVLLVASQGEVQPILEATKPE